MYRDTKVNRTHIWCSGYLSCCKWDVVLPGYYYKAGWLQIQIWLQHNNYSCHPNRKLEVTSSIHYFSFLAFNYLLNPTTFIAKTFINSKSLIYMSVLPIRSLVLLIFIPGCMGLLNWPPLIFLEFLFKISYFFERSINLNKLWTFFIIY
jgi:hypothetical protein